MSEKNGSVQEVLAELEEWCLQLETIEAKLARRRKVSTEAYEAINYLHQLYLEIQQEIKALQGHEHDDQKDLYDGLETHMKRLREYYAKAMTMLPPY